MSNSPGGLLPLSAYIVADSHSLVDSSPAGSPTSSYPCLSTQPYPPACHQDLIVLPVHTNHTIHHDMQYNNTLLKSGA
jgi:hypothetical protein